jgi:CRISPR/Cas system-associated endonuclease Cas1
VYLTDDGQRVFLKAFYEKLNETLTVNNESVSYDTIIKLEIRKLIRHFKQKEKYKAFRQVR